MKVQVILSAFLLSLLSGCGNQNVEYKYPKMVKDERESKMGNILTGEDEQGINLFGGNKQENVGVNANTVLWQASLDVVNFMPITVSDYTGGVISTDWYEISGHKGARYRVTINIKGHELSANSLKVVMFKQIFKEGAWHNSSASQSMVDEFELKILNKAREIKMSGRL
jgi:hypothetical protein